MPTPQDTGAPVRGSDAVTNIATFPQEEGGAQELQGEQSVENGGREWGGDGGGQGSVGPTETEPPADAVLAIPVDGQQEESVEGGEEGNGEQGGGWELEGETDTETDPVAVEGREGEESASRQGEGGLATAQAANSQDEHVVGDDVPPPAVAAVSAAQDAEDARGGWAWPTPEEEPQDGQNGVSPGSDVDVDVAGEGEQAASGAAVATFLGPPPATTEEEQGGREGEVSDSEKGNAQEGDGNGEGEEQVGQQQSDAYGLDGNDQAASAVEPEAPVGVDLEASAASPSSVGGSGNGESGSRDGGGGHSREAGSAEKQLAQSSQEVGENKYGQEQQEEGVNGWGGEEQVEEQWQVQSTHAAGSGPEGSAGVPAAKVADGVEEELAEGGGEAPPSASSSQPNEWVTGGGGGGGGGGSSLRSETVKGKACTSEDDCGGNGHLRCSSGGVCECRFPWSGATCGEDGCQTHASSCNECRRANEKAMGHDTSFGCVWDSEEVWEEGGAGGSCRGSSLPLPLGAFSACPVGKDAAAAAAAPSTSVNERYEAAPDLWYAAGLPLLFVAICGGVLMLGAKCIRRWCRGGSDGPDYTP